MGIFDCLFTGTGDITIYQFLIGVGSALILGIILGLVHTFKGEYTKSFVITLALLPAVVSMVIMMVSGSIGAGIAVAGTFSLVRFRSVPGTAKEIGTIFLAMAVGLSCGMGYPAFAVVFTIITSVANILLAISPYGEKPVGNLRKVLHITVPEDLEYEGEFEDIFSEFTQKSELIGVKTTALGSLNRLTYDITLKAPGLEKQMIDKLRCRNGNLEINITCAGVQKEIVQL